MFSRKLTRSVAAGTAAIAVAIGAYAIVNSSSGNGGSGTANATRVAQSGPNQRVVGYVPPNWRPRTGTIITGAAANKAKAAALARYPGGTVKPCAEAERRFVRRPHDQDQLAAPRLRQQELRGHRRHRVGAPPFCPLAVSVGSRHRPSCPGGPSVGMIQRCEFD